MKNIYTYLDSINFEKRVMQKVHELKNCENTNSFTAVASNMVMLNWAYHLLSDLYDKIYEDVKELEK